MTPQEKFVTSITGTAVVIIAVIAQHEINKERKLRIAAQNKLSLIRTVLLRDHLARYGDQNAMTKVVIDAMDTTIFNQKFNEIVKDEF